MVAQGRLAYTIKPLTMLMSKRHQLCIITIAEGGWSYKAQIEA
jgi:hypothetical protein